MMKKMLFFLSAALCLMLSACGPDMEQTAAAEQSGAVETIPNENEPEPEETIPNISASEPLTECCTVQQIAQPPGCCG